MDKKVKFFYSFTAVGSKIYTIASMCEDLLSVLSLDIGGIWGRSGEHVCGVDTAPAGENILH